VEELPDRQGLGFGGGSWPTRDEAKDFLLTQNGEQYNSLYNSVGDQLVTTLGYYLGKHGTLKTWGIGLAGTFTTMILLDDRVG